MSYIIVIKLQNPVVRLPERDHSKQVKDRVLLPIGEEEKKIIADRKSPTIMEKK